MAELPVPANIYFNDFKFELITFEINRNNQTIAKLEGMPNEENGKPYIHFLNGSDIRIEDKLVSNGEIYKVKKTDTDTYQGKPELLKISY